jgi:hypothetical protein
VAAVFFLAVGWTAPASAQAKRTEIQGIDKTPLSLCTRGSLQFLRHTRRSLKFPGIEYCNDPEWNVSDVEQDASHVYWSVPFGDGAEEQYGAGKVFCRCRRR